MKLMESFSLNSLKNYFVSTLGIEISFLLWKGQKKLPFFLTDLYTFYEGDLLGLKCLFMVANGVDQPSLPSIKKHLEQTSEMWQGIRILVFPTISSSHRKLLTEKRIPFIVPGNQLYLPDLGMELKEHFKPLRKKKERLFLSPAAQSTLLHALNRWPQEKKFLPINASLEAKILGYTSMTMGRALLELEEAGFATIDKTHKEHWLQLQGTGQELWEKAKHLMKSPVKRRTWLSEVKPTLIAAGLTALSHYTLLAEPRLQTFAISAEQWKRLIEGTEEPATEACIEVEIWNYCPLFLSLNGSDVDPFSLYLTLQGNKDERIQSALEEMMRQIPW